MPTTIRSRDVRYNIKEFGFEQGITVSLERMLDEFAEYRQHMREIVELQQQMIDNLERLQAVGTSLQSHIDRIRREHDQGKALDAGNIT